MSHNIDHIIRHDEKTREDKRKKRKRKDKRKNTQGPPETCSSPQGKRSHFEEAELDQAVPISEPALSEDQKTPNPEPTACEPEKTASNNGGEQSQPETSTDAKDKPKEKKVDGGTHRAGFDAFMTGYIFAHAINLTKKKEDSSTAPLIPTCLNKLFLSGKSVPLNVTKSTFSKSSKAHMLKMDYVWGKKSDVNMEENA